MYPGVAPRTELLHSSRGRPLAALLPRNAAGGEGGGSKEPEPLREDRRLSVVRKG